MLCSWSWWHQDGMHARVRVGRTCWTYLVHFTQTTHPQFEQASAQYFDPKVTMGGEGADEVVVVTSESGSSVVSTRTSTPTPPIEISYAEKVKIAHDAYLRELHNIDTIVEMHSGIVLALSAGLLAFVASNTQNFVLVVITSTFGLLISVEWLCKLHRHQEIFDHCFKRVKETQDMIAIDALRPDAKYCNGFQMLFILCAAIFGLWISLLSVGIYEYTHYE